LEGVRGNQARPVERQDPDGRSYPLRCRVQPFAPFLAAANDGTSTSAILYEEKAMIINRSKLLLSLVSALVLILSCSLAANAKLSVNLLSANLLSANSLSDKTKFDLQAVTVSKVTLPDGTVLIVRY
jgi:hypothetical protein